MRTLRHRLTVEVPADEVGHDGAAASLADCLAESVPQLGRSRSDDAGGVGVPVGGSVFGHVSSIGGGLPPRLVIGNMVDIHHVWEVAMRTANIYDSVGRIASRMRDGQLLDNGRN